MAAPAWKDDGDLYRRPLPPSRPSLATRMSRPRRDSNTLRDSRPGSLSTLYDHSTSGSGSTSTTRSSQADSLAPSSASSRSSYEITQDAGGESHKSSRQRERSSTPRAGGQTQPSQPGKSTPASIPSRSLGGWLSRLHVRRISQEQPQKVAIGQLSENANHKFNTEVVPRFRVLMRTIVQGSRYAYKDELAYNLENRDRPTVVISCRHEQRAVEVERALKNPQFGRYLQSLGWNAVTKVDPHLGLKGRSSRRSRGARSAKSPHRPHFNVDVCMSSKATTTTGALLRFTQSGVDPMSLKYKEGGPAFSTCGGLILVNGVLKALTTKHAFERLEFQMLIERTSIAKPPIDSEWPPVEFGTIDQCGRAYGFAGERFGEFRADWLLINVNEALVLPNQVSMTWSRREISTLTHPLNCVIHTSRWPIYGSLDGSQAVFSARAVSTMQFVVQLGEELLPGDSGSWVTADGKLLGMVIAASSEPFQAYIDAAEDVFGEISESNYGANVSLPSAIENDLFRMKAQARQEPARSLSVHGFTLQQLPDAIMSTVKSRTAFTLGHTSTVWPLIEDTERTDHTLGFMVGEDLPRYDPLVTNPVPVRALIWLGMQVPVSSELRIILVPRPGELQDIPAELLQSAAGENLIVLMHALRGLVSLEDMPGFMLSLFSKFEIPSDEIPGVRFLKSLTTACESLVKHRSITMEKTIVNSPISKTRISPDNHTDFALFLGAISKLNANDKRDIVLCMGSWNDWIHNFCQCYLDIAVWRWQSDDGLSKEVLLWLEQEPPRSYPQIWLVDRPGPFRCRIVQNNTLGQIYIELVDQYYLLIKNGSIAPAAEPIELEPLPSEIERYTAIGLETSVFNAKTAWCLPLFVKRAVKQWKRKRGPQKLNMKTSSILFRAANRWMITALGRGISKTAMDRMYRDFGYRIPRSVEEPPTRERGYARGGTMASVSQPRSKIGYNAAPYDLDVESRPIQPRFDDRPSQVRSTSGIEPKQREMRRERESDSEYDDIASGQTRRSARAPHEIYIESDSVFDDIISGQLRRSDPVREQEFDDYPSRHIWSSDDVYSRRRDVPETNIERATDYDQSQSHSYIGDDVFTSHLPARGGYLNVGSRTEVEQRERREDSLRRRQEDGLRRQYEVEELRRPGEEESLRRSNRGSLSQRRSDVPGNDGRLRRPQEEEEDLYGRVRRRGEDVIRRQREEMLRPTEEDSIFRYWQ